MKQVFLVAVLAIIGFTAKAQFVANASGCDIEFRQICIDPLSCNVTYPSTTWQSAPANMHTPLALSRCNPGDIIGFEVQYASSTGCTNPSVFIQDIGTPATCPGIFNNTQMGFCPCSPNPLGATIHFNGLNLHVDN